MNVHEYWGGGGGGLIKIFQVDMRSCSLRKSSNLPSVTNKIFLNVYLKMFLIQSPSAPPVPSINITEVLG